MVRCRLSAKDVRIRRVLSKIEQFPAVTVQELARLVKLSSSRLGHLFKSETGMELRHFLLEAKLDKAAEYLRDTDMQVKEISHTVGYHHVPSFDRVFRKKFKASPADYRRREPLYTSTQFEVITPAPANGVNTNRANTEGSDKC
ncbi:MAG TPA: AraC family transcriptional regulator [Candidatus Angelobacter sp.]